MCKPIGSYDKVCVRAYRAVSFEAEYGTIGEYQRFIAKNPEKHPRFLKARETWIRLHIENPDSRIHESQVMEGCEVSAVEGTMDHLEAPDKRVRSARQIGRASCRERVYSGV